jgi:hypothetical protein
VFPPGGRRQRRAGIPPFVGAAESVAAAGRCYNVAAQEWLTWDRYTELVAAAADRVNSNGSRRP